MSALWSPSVVLFARVDRARSTFGRRTLGNNEASPNAPAGSETLTLQVGDGKGFCLM
jgi:hypothetical protein